MKTLFALLAMEGAVCLIALFDPSPTKCGATVMTCIMLAIATMLVFCVTKTK